MLPTITRIPQIIDRLIALAHDATGLQVTDGAHIGELDDDALCVGLTLAENAGYQVTVAQEPSMGRGRYRENFTVRCLLSLWTGATDMKPLRDRCGTYLGDLSTALADAPSVAGTWDSVRLGESAEWIPLQTPQGATLSVIFTVEGSCLL